MSDWWRARRPDDLIVRRVVQAFTCAITPDEMPEKTAEALELLTRIQSLEKTLSVFNTRDGYADRNKLEQVRAEYIRSYKVLEEKIITERERITNERLLREKAEREARKRAEQELLEKTELIAYTDGSNLRQVMLFGAIIVDRNDREQLRLWGRCDLDSAPITGGGATAAEALAVREAVKAAATLGVTSIKVYSDSKSLVQVLTGAAKFRAGPHPCRWRDETKQIARKAVQEILDSNVRIFPEWIPRKQNKRAHQIADLAEDLDAGIMKVVKKSVLKYVAV